MVVDGDLTNYTLEMKKFYRFEFLDKFEVNFGSRKSCLLFYEMFTSRLLSILAVLRPCLRIILL